ncbi:MAG: Gfo/Idh/MocA family protein [bacterium]
MPSLKVGIVGCGRISHLHFLGYRDNRKAVVTAVCDRNRNRARQRAKSWHVEKVFTDYQRFLEDPETELIELLVPHDLHAPMTIAACQAGKHVSVQKPMALTVAEAEQMIQAAAENRVILRIFENFVFYPPFVKARQMLQAGEIGEPRMLRVHMNTGTQKTGWDVPLSAWYWRFNEKRAGGGPIVFDHGYHLFSLAYHLLGKVKRVSAWIDRSPIIPTKTVDAPATVMMQFKKARCYGVMDFVHTPQMQIDSDYYADDNRVEIIGDKGVLMINRFTARALDLPPLLMFRNGKTTHIAVDRMSWEHSFIDATRHLVRVIKNGGQPELDGETGKYVLQFTLAALQSAQTGKAICPEEVL